MNNAKRGTLAMRNPLGTFAKDLKPVHTVRRRNLKASDWRNDTERGSMYNVLGVRSCREAEQWHDSVSPVNPLLTFG